MAGVMTQGLRIRDFEGPDWAALYRVCLRTGDSGADGTHLFPDDPDALGRYYVGPYLALEPGLALVLADGSGARGYALAARDSRAFYAAAERDWFPALRREFPRPDGDPSTWSPARRMHDLYHRPDWHLPEPYEQYPSHLHIDLEPEVQGLGMGRPMMEELMDRLRRLGSPGVHLGMAETNARAERFYRKLGFEKLAHVGDTLYLGRRLG